MSVDIEPLELSFRRPFAYEVSQILTIKNPNKTPVAFKVKTTAPKQYCVRPNAGRIEPGSSFDVTVLLQAMKQEPAPDAKCRDKFLVQSAPITGEKEFDSIASVLDQTEKSAITERKIRVNWLPALNSDEAASTPSIAVTPSKQSVNGGHSADTPDVSKFASPGAESPPPAYADEKSEVEDVKPETPKAAVSAAATTISATAKEATTTDATMRQRVKTTTAGAKQAGGQLAQAVPQNVQGVPVKITALLCLLAFLVGYFFF